MGSALMIRFIDFEDKVVFELVSLVVALKFCG